MLVQLLNFNTNMNNSTNKVNNQKLKSNFYILWDYTTGCVTKNNYIVGIYDSNNRITQSTFYNLNYIRYSYFNNFQNGNFVNYNDILLVAKSNIYVILNYAQEVYTDILQKFDYLIRGAQYCDKDYMNIKNIPILVNLYKNFYNNQVYTVNNGLPSTSIVNIKPVYVNINKYINDFVNYYTSNNIGQILNTLILNNEEGFVFCYINGVLDPSTMTRPNYSYYYINIYNPSAIQIYNFWGTTEPTPYYTDPTLNIFINQFIYTGTGTIQPYLETSNSNSAILNNTYYNAGLYLINSPPYSNVLIYYFYNTDSSLNSKVLLTYETELGNAVGLPLVYYPL